ncbi:MULTISPECIES: Fe-S cluster assembly ATPase SufC [Caproicibacterium]|uniref:Fe-S cluster assembly ATPase SufC n=1 Tax=Caproicibacterium argilliputei TaxID=3030016 RepID=A0AA97H2X5_9FIRM|nr:Fe-S cluster assembly ATPase SufC [Caproicibacterium argilliputei]WOC32642.1 Fe-S cluster assembly ATPase SufC [Caproicibacterium argilliputei]
MSKNLLEVSGVHASVEGKEILSGLNLTVAPGETHVIMGPNGAGKSTLGNVILGNPEYQVDAGSITFDGADITAEKTDARARRGIFYSFQSPEEVPGVTLEDFLRVSKTAITGKPLKVFAFQKELKKTMEALQMDEAYAHRYLNVGFSGGEKKKAEILQMLILQPKLAILDETDSGLDVDAVRVVSEGIRRYKNKENALLIITHNAKILEGLHVDYVHVLADGKIIHTGGPELIEEISREGFHRLEEGAAQ